MTLDGDRTARRSRATVRWWTRTQDAVGQEEHVARSLISLHSDPLMIDVPQQEHHADHGADAFGDQDEVGP